MLHDLPATFRFFHRGRFPVRVCGRFPALRSSTKGGEEVTFSQSEKNVEVSVPVASQNDLDSIVVLEMGQSANGMKPILVGP
jgi:hypothetical protein